MLLQTLLVSATIVGVSFGFFITPVSEVSEQAAETFFLLFLSILLLIFGVSGALFGAFCLVTGLLGFVAGVNLYHMREHVRLSPSNDEET